ncbi:MAG: GH3 auxin-responsive promoter family protein [Planctomycetaceae bacterium]
MEWWYRLRCWGGAATRARIRRESRRYHQAALHCRESQAEILGQILALNEESRFSRERGLSARLTPDEYRRQMPVVDGDFYRPYVEQLRQGDRAALLGSSQKLMMFALTSGTTAESKYIPITDRFLSDYRRGWQIWGLHAFDDHPRLHYLNIFQLTSDHDQFRTPGGTPCGNISGLVSTIQSRFVKTLYTLPLEIAKIHHGQTKYYTALRLGLADRYVGVLMTANPSTLVRIAQLADRQKSSLIRDLFDGTLTIPHDDAISPENGLRVDIRQQLARRISRPNRSRARELESIVQRTGSLFPKDFWPRLELIAVWTGGSAGAYLHQLRQYYGEVPVRDHGLSASEGRMTIPFADETAAGLLDINSHYFEFIPEAERESANPVVLEAHELEVDRNYYILLTTSSGLYRYDIRDVVRCVGFRERTPLLEFLHKGAHISNVTGEKLNESQVIAAVRSSFERLKQPLETFVLAPQWGDPPGYRLLLESRHLPPLEIAGRIAAEVDRYLQQHNSEYRDKRQTERLAPIRCQSLPDGTWTHYIAARHARMQGNIEQYKHPCLFTDLKAIEELCCE